MADKMEAPPTYEEALAAKGQASPTKTPAQIPYYPPQDNRTFIPPPVPAPAYGQDDSYQDSRLVTVVVAPPTTNSRTLILERQNDVNHCLHCCITFLFWPWIFVWIFLCLVSEN